jgi:hypothetical protein
MLKNPSCDRSDTVFGTHGQPAAFTKATGEHHGFVQISCGFGIVVSDDGTPTFSTIFRQELSEPEFSAIPGASTTIRRTSSTVLMPIEANVRRQQREALASVSQTLFGKCISGVARDSNALQARR